MSLEGIHEPIDVLAAFAGGRVTPRLFRWQARSYPIAQINQRWSTRDGDSPIYYYAVSSGGNAYKLAFFPREMRWQLEAVYPADGG
jgi:hypothetical protein